MKLIGYQLGENLYVGTRTLVYRGERTSDRQPVIIKVLRNPHPSFKELVQFRNQYIITRNLEHPRIVRPIALERYGNGYALVMLDEGAIALTDYWQQSSRSLTEFLDIAIKLAETLHYLSGERIIHKDIKPANIVINPESGKIQLIDFSISSLLPREQQQLVNPNVLEGTLAYISPEQTGRMNRGIDYRTDFYSLGVTFFEMVTGELPFESSDPMELVHSHIAKMPRALGNCELGIGNGGAIPEVIENIVRRLMAKNAEERYQSALGLKYDLELCRQEWEAKGEITNFELGENDRSDRFLIPEKLYGREREVEKLLEAFARVAKGKSEMMLVAGFSGIGKTAVVSEVHKPIVQQRGYFIKGKFDQFNRNIPFSAFVQAFRDLMGQLLGSTDVELEAWKENILAALGESGQVLIEVIPELERIIGKQSPVPELSGNAAQNRFNLLFQRFIAVFTTPEHPLVMFLDDLQWADSASLNLMKVLMASGETGYLLLLGAYRDNEVYPAHPLMLALSELEKERAVISTLVLEPLEIYQINQLVADALSCSPEFAEPLTELVYQKAKGNPFFTTQFLKGLHQEELIEFNWELGYWECDLVQVRDAALTEDVVEFMAGRLALLPEATQKVLKLAACIGNQFELETLATICEESSEEVASDMWRALQEGLILPISEAYKFFQGGIEEGMGREATVGYRFLHDRVQQAAYSLIPEERKPSTHLSIGQLLLAKISSSQTEEQIFAIVNQLNRGIELIGNTREQIELAFLNLKAGRKAKAAVAYGAAVEYFQTGIELLGRDRWRDNRDLTLELYNAAAEAAYLNSNYALMEQWLDEIFRWVPTLLARIPAYEVKIQAQIAQNQLQDSVATGLGILERLEVQLPPAPTPDDIERGFAATTAQMEGKTPEDLIALTDMTAPEKLAALKMLAGIWGAAFAIAPPLMPLIVLEMVNLSVRYGNAPISAFAYVLYGVLLCGGENFQGGYEFGELSLKLLNRFNTQAFKAKILFLIGTHITIWHEPVRAALPTLQEAYQAGLETGDLEFAALPAAIYSYYSYLAGLPLSDVKREFVAYSQAVERIKQTYYLNFLHIWHQAVANLMEGSRNNSFLSGKICNDEELLAAFKRDNLTTPTAYIYINRLMLSYLFCHYTDAVEVSPLADDYAQMVPATLLIPVSNFYGSLSKLAFCSPMPESERDSWLDAVGKNQCKMQKWSECAPMNYGHKYYLVEAERYRVVGDKMEAMELYDRAIAGAKANEYIQEEALANELAAKFYLDWGKEKIAATYMTDAYYCYARWGAKAKTDQLEEKYPQLLSPILQQPQAAFKIGKTIEATQTLGTATSSSSSSSLLDLASAIKASQAVSEEISLDALLSKFMQIVMENAGADKGALILNQSGTWVQVARNVNGNSELANVPLEEADSLPPSIINTVKRSQETLIINEVAPDTTFAGDPYLIQEQPISLFCTPILHQGELIGILYLENNLTAGAFTPDRVEILNLLTAQAAISLENAQLYNTLEEKVQQRTAELSDALENLKATQKQLVESEKMAALGGLVAGVAHEINTPIGTSITVASTLADETQSFLGAVASGQLKRSVLNNYLDLASESTQLMLSNLHRAGELIQSFKQIATDQSNLEQRRFNLKEYLEEIALSLAPKLKQTPHTLTVAGEEAITIESYPGALAQITTNLVTNSLTHAYTSEQAGQLRLEISLEGDKVRVEYSDDGCGINRENKGKIFEPFFTTARHRGGTGLGLHIVYNLVTQKLLGTIEVESEVGSGTSFAMLLPRSVN